ncbi:14703_t:CDS:2 [Entrophospora sp. SA101]|nr:14703_t:CDS:2 [Entrophospora sp. SA101]
MRYSRIWHEILSLRLCNLIDNKLSYNLKTDNIETNIENVLQLVVYLRETVCGDGLWIKTILEREPTRYNYKLKALLPRLLNGVAKSRTYRTQPTLTQVPPNLPLDSIKPTLAPYWPARLAEAKPPLPPPITK